MKNSLRIRTFCYIASGMLIIIAAFTFLFFRYYYAVFRERIEEDTVYASARTQESIASIITNIQQNAYYLCISPSLAQLLSNDDVTATQFDEINLTFSMNTGTLSTPLMKSAYAMLFLDTQFPRANLNLMKGVFSFKNGYFRQRIYSALDVLGDEWYQRTMQLRGQIHAFRDPQDTQHIFFSHLLRSVRIANPRYNENLGVVLYAVPETTLLKMLQSAQITDGADALLLFDDHLFMSTDTELFPLDGMPESDLQTLLALPSSGQITEITLGGRRYTASSGQFQGSWQSVLLIPDTDLYHYALAPMSMFVVVFILFLLVSALISLVLSVRLARPIVALSDVMAQVQDRGTLPPPVPAPKSDDEIAVLYNSYNLMTERIKRLVEQSAREAEKLHGAQIRAMQAQINPHFIYNTLDSVSCSAMLEGNNDIVTMVTSLISILKYRVNFSRTVVPLKEEVENLEHYIRIQELRFTNGFQYECSIGEAYSDTPISPIVLQPLVENALFHAQSHDGRLVIRLYCEEAEGRLRIHVADNGSGGSAEMLNALLSGPQTQSDDGHGIGIRNVDLRIRLLFGEGHGLHYEQLEGGGLDAVVEIPLGHMAPGDEDGM